MKFNVVSKNGGGGVGWSQTLRVVIVHIYILAIHLVEEVIRSTE